MQKILRDIVQKNNSKIVFVVMDGLGGLPVEGRTELEAADTPNLDRLAQQSACGLHYPVAPGITPGSGPGHLSLFGYDPVGHPIGRGILEALGLGMDVRKTDIAIRCNYSSVENGLVTDRRAGRIPTAQSLLLTEKLRAEIRKIDEAEVLFAPGMEHRFAVVFRFPEALSEDAARINDTDPQKEGRAALQPAAGSQAAEPVVRVAEKFIRRAEELLQGEPKANHVLLRGFAVLPNLLSFEEAYGLKALAIANYPMYRGLAKLVGMEAPEISGDVPEEIDFLKQQYDSHDFFFLHVKKIDSYGEDGKFSEKAARISEFDALLPRILAMEPDVLVITGDHSTPSLMKGHSWHPVPVLVHSPYVLGGLCKGFSERECVGGELSIFHTVHLMSLALANAGRLKKFGA